ncbi:von Willebrand factor type A domain-containing protein [Pleionea sp. CnH1-48]|uniref:vWA domain-containing protein n=1 Tax=Pleionea sp. CnH1-48 TaxID=2954494 RepID=UPI0020979CC3|nr:von Willebrand factor type A domain-containing protein [Pleionea sp. CnH1-48]MCO7223203.1 von Willebrand factor type A domain-containing protein [Pleionea sp. CnH1-48]
MKLGHRVFRTTVVAAAAFLIVSCAMRPQESETVVVESPVEKVVITGSRIKRGSAEGLVEVVVETDRRVIINTRREPYSHPISAQQIFQNYGVNPTVQTLAEPASTFAMDVDNASYRLAQHMLKQGNLPDKDGIRVEEFVNAFDYRYQSGSKLFSVSAEVFPSPFREGFHIMHVGIQTPKISREERLPANLVLVADISGSMRGDNKLQLLKDGMKTLVAQLREDDQVAIIAYNNYAKTHLQPTSARYKRSIFSVIDSLDAGGGTNAEAGIKTAYSMADRMFQPGFNNRVILTSDGMANVGSTSADDILKEIQRQKERGVFLTTVGVGTGMYNDVLLEQLANKGNGHYLYLGDQNDIQESFVDALEQQLQTVAKDAKIQVVFNPDQVTSYRLLGYENRGLEAQDFLDAKKDGGELGAGHQVTALYEVKLASSLGEQELARFDIAYKKPSGQKVFTQSTSLPLSVLREDIMQSSSDSRLSAAVAAFAEKLRLSYWSRVYQYADIQDLINQLPPAYLRSSQVQDLVEMIRSARRYDHRFDPYEEKWPVSSINLDHVPLLQ